MIYDPNILQPAPPQQDDTAAKASALRAVMNDPGTRKSIFEAANSEYGSTKLDSANRLMNIVKSVGGSRTQNTGSAIQTPTGPVGETGGINMPTNGSYDPLARAVPESVGYDPAAMELPSAFTVPTAVSGGIDHIIQGKASKDLHLAQLPSQAGISGPGESYADPLKPKETGEYGPYFRKGGKGSVVQPDASVSEAISEKTQQTWTEDRMAFPDKYGTPTYSSKLDLGNLYQQQTPEERRKQSEIRVGKFTQGESDSSFNACIASGGDASSCFVKAKETTGIAPSVDLVKAAFTGSIVTGPQQPVGEQAPEQGPAAPAADQATPAAVVETVTDPSIEGQSGGQCGEFVNDIAGTRVGDSLQSKIDQMTFTDPNQAKVGDVFVQSIANDPNGYGHIGFINAITTDAQGNRIFTVTESNYNLDEKITTTRQIAANDPAIKGFTSPGNAGSGFTPNPSSLYGMTDVAKMALAAAQGNSKDLDAFMQDLRVSDPATAANLEPVYQQIKSGSGVSALQLKALGDTKLMSQITGIPEDQLDKMPFDLISGPKLDELRANARKAYDLDVLEAKYMDSVATGINAKEALSNYVKGKDQYLGRVEKMIYDYEKLGMSQDMSNPATAQRYQHHLNMLYGLKGNRQKRYIDLINSSLEQVNNDAARIKLIYDSKSQEANSLYEQMASRADSTWKTMVPALNDSVAAVYDFLDKRDERAQEKAKSQLELIRTAAGIIKDETESPFRMAQLVADTQLKQAQAKKALKDTGGEEEFTNKLTTSDLINFAGVREPSEKDPLGALTVLSPSEVYNYAKTQKTDPKTVNTFYSNASAKYLSNLIMSSGKIVDSLGQFTSVIENLDGIPDDQKDAFQQTYAEGIEQGVKAGIVKLVAANSDQFVKAAQQLGKGKVKDMAALRKLIGSEVGDDVVEVLWELYQKLGASIGGLTADQIGQQLAEQAVAGPSQ